MAVIVLVGVGTSAMVWFGVMGVGRSAGCEMYQLSRTPIPNLHRNKYVTSAKSKSSSFG